MHNTICIFNPEHDMALASSSRYYMTPAHIMKMKSDLSILPIWYSYMFIGEVSVIGKESDIMFVDNLKAIFSCLSSFSVISSLEGSFDELLPWGWNSALLNSIISSDLSLSVIPGYDEVEIIRQLSSRCNAVTLLSLINESQQETKAESFCFSSLEDVKCFVRQYKKVILKAPWSGSGRGVRKIESELSESDSGWVQRVIRTQKCVVGEPFYDKVLDFAMEFSCKDSEVTFIGYSVFETDSMGAYKCNILDSDEALEKAICSYVSQNELNDVRKKLEELLCEQYAKQYNGVLGVDMMICRGEDGYWIHPCVEVNVRMNMGIVARRFYDRFVSSNSKGVYHVEHYFSKSDAIKNNRIMKEKHPLVIVNEKIESGYISLTTVNDDTLFQIYALIENRL